MSIIDATHTLWREWTMEAILRSYTNPKMLDTIEAPPYWKHKSKIIIAGAGSSLKLIEKIWDEKSFVVANQSSVAYLTKIGIPIDCVIITDPKVVAAEKLARSMKKYYDEDIIRAPYQPIYIAAYHCTNKLGELLFDDDEHLHPLYYIPMYAQRAAVYNAVLKELVEPNKLFVYQIGNVVNASILVMNVLSIYNQIKEMPIVLSGLDLSYGKLNEKPMEHIEEDIINDPPGGFMEKDGEITDVRFVKYEEQLAIAVQGSKLPVYIYNPGSRLEKIVKPWRIK
jgi:hypothetical protein